MDNIAQSFSHFDVDWHKKATEIPLVIWYIEILFLALFPVSSKTSYIMLAKEYEGHDIKFLTQAVLK